MSREKFSFLFLLTFVSLFIFVPRVNAQMIGAFQNQPSITPTQQDLQDIQTGKDLFTKFENQQITCKELKEDDFEKIGEFVMNQRFGNANQHVQMNENMKQMMGEQGEENMHVSFGKAATGCGVTSQSKGGGGNMMGWGYNYPNMMGGNNWAFAGFHAIIALVVLIDLILLGMFLWKKIKK